MTVTTNDKRKQKHMTANEIVLQNLDQGLLTITGRTGATRSTPI
jgi:hypothetical protein